MFETFERLHKEYQAKAKTPQEELSQVALETLEGYFGSNSLPSERIAQMQKMIASEGWSPRQERDLRVAYIFWTARAWNALDAGKDAQAEQLANQSLRLRPDQPKAFQVLALAQFAQADFSGAAAAYRKILETKLRFRRLSLCTLRLCGSGPEERRCRVSTVGRGRQGDKPREVDVSAAGLALLAGDADSPRRLEIELQQSGDLQAPVQMGELGWWHYLNGDYKKAVDMLSAAVQQRPGDLNLWLGLAWAQIEIRRYGDVLQTLNGAIY